MIPRPTLTSGTMMPSYFESATTVDVTIGEEMTVNEDLWVGSTIQGTVTDASSGNPIPSGISVWVFDLDHAFAGFAQVNGGQYEVKEPPPRFLQNLLPGRLGHHLHQRVAPRRCGLREF